MGPATGSTSDKGDMIARTAQPWHPEDWQRQLAAGLRDPAALLSALEIAPARIAADLDGDRAFPLRVPHSYMRRMRKGDPGDPLLRQVLPLTAEQRTIAGYMADPVGDLAAARAPGVIHKYRGRALLITTGACAVHCRYCFRRHFPYAELHGGADGWRAAVGELQHDPSIREVILSGGDPLVLTNTSLSALLQQLDRVPHLARLRVHSRLPIVLPARIDDALLELLASMRLTPVMVIHANHPNEIDKEVAATIARLREARIPVLNQTVLLKGVNDSAATLAELSERLFDAGVTPYYLHMLDRVQGAAHFDVDEKTARRIYGELLAALSGYLVPRLVREVPGAPGKMLIEPERNEEQSVRARA